MTTANPFSHDFPIGRVSGQCAGCGNALQPGQPYYAVIWRQDEHYVRKDYDQACWRVPPPDALGVWRAKMPVPQNKPRRRHVPAKLLLDVFERLGQADGLAASRMRFVLALLLLRRRLLRDAGLHTADGVQTWRLKRPGEEAFLEVACPPLTGADAEELSQQLSDLLAGLEEQAEALE